MNMVELLRTRCASKTIENFYNYFYQSVTHICRPYWEYRKLLLGQFLQLFDLSSIGLLRLPLRHHLFNKYIYFGYTPKRSAFCHFFFPPKRSAFCNFFFLFFPPKRPAFCNFFFLFFPKTAGFLQLFFPQNGRLFSTFFFFFFSPKRPAFFEF